MAIPQSILELIGNTPVVQLNKIGRGMPGRIVVKLESFNPCSNIKDRIALAMIDAAERSGQLKPGGTVIEPTSGNTGVGLAMVCSVRGYRLILTMPDTMSLERRWLLSALGAELVLTPGEEGMRGSVQRAEQLMVEIKGAYMPQQFSNSVNPEAHRNTTAQEMWNQLDGQIDMFVSGIGTGGTLTGVGEYLKAQNAKIKIIALEPKEAAILSGGSTGINKIQGLGAGFIPEVLNREIIDEIITVSNQEAGSMTQRLAKEEGILAGISSGANVHAAIQLASRPENQGKVIVTLICDTGERYLSGWPFKG